MDKFHNFLQPQCLKHHIVVICHAWVAPWHPLHLASAQPWDLLLSLWLPGAKCYSTACHGANTGIRHLPSSFWCLLSREDGGDKDLFAKSRKSLGQLLLHWGRQRNDSLSATSLLFLLPPTQAGEKFCVVTKIYSLDRVLYNILGLSGWASTKWKIPATPCPCVSSACHNLWHSSGRTSR